MSEGKHPGLVAGGKGRWAKERAAIDKAAVLETENAKLHKLNGLLIDALTEAGQQDRLVAIFREVA